MVKQILRDSFFDAKQHKGRLMKELLLLIVFVVSALCNIPNNCILSLVVFAHIKKWDCEKEHMPEMVAFLPMSQKEKQRYISIKSYAKAIGLSGLLLLSFIYIALFSEKYMLDDTFWWDRGCQMISFYFYICLLELSIESAKWRRMKAGIGKQSQGTLKSSVTYGVFALVLTSIFCWCSMFYVEEADASNTTLLIERVILSVLLIILYISYRCLKKMILKEFIYSDYNAKITKEQEVDYEY